MRSRFLLVVLMSIFSICRASPVRIPNEEAVDVAARQLKLTLLENYRSSEKKTIGIASFARTDLITPNAEYRSVVPKLGVLLGNALQNEMFAPETFDLVERLRIEELLKESNLYQTGLMDPNTLRSVQLTGVDYILLGTLQKRESSIRVDARLVSLDGGKVVSVATAIVPLTGNVVQLYNDYPERSSTYTHAVTANQGWQQVQAPIQGGVTVEVTTEGNWSMTNDGYQFDGTGVSANPSRHGDYRIDRSFNHGALLCRVTGQQTFFTVGNSDIHGTGLIECTINDKDQQNNRGALTVTFKIAPLDR
ncbi:MAG: CsgG/HfaB family protein [Leptospirales bacterium]|nr:CsgG/HfaB family protein [Leptospirales bacterium]